MSNLQLNLGQRWQGSARPREREPFFFSAVSIVFDIFAVYSVWQPLQLIFSRQFCVLASLGHLPSLLLAVCAGLGVRDHAAGVDFLVEVFFYLQFLRLDILLDVDRARVHAL